MKKLIDKIEYKVTHSKYSTYLTVEMYLMGKRLGFVLFERDTSTGEFDYSFTEVDKAPYFSISQNVLTDLGTNYLGEKGYFN